MEVCNLQGTRQSGTKRIMFMSVVTSKQGKSKRETCFNLGRKPSNPKGITVPCADQMQVSVSSSCSLQ